MNRFTHDPQRAARVKRMANAHTHGNGHKLRAEIRKRELAAIKKSKKGASSSSKKE